MKIVVLGTRGFPNIQGGVEKHCENLYSRLNKLGCEVIVFGRAPYLKKEGQSPKNGDSPSFFQGAQIIPISCPKQKFLEAIVHTLKGIFAAKILNPDLLHIHAIGPSIWVPLAKFMGLKVVMTHHGPDYERKKWNWFAKMVLKLGERWGVKYANRIITISDTIAEHIKTKYGKTAIVIPNGVTLPQILEVRDSPQRTGTIPVPKGKYILAVGRFVPEKGFHDLIEAFQIVQGQSPKNGDSPCRLVIVGDADHEDEYSRSLKAKASQNQNVILTGFLSGQPLQELYSNAGLFVLPSYYEGLPIVLLEAMSYGLSCLVSDIPANREVTLPNERYFKAGDIEGMAKKISEYMARPLIPEEKNAQIKLIAEKYNWNRIAEKTLEVYKGVL